MSSGNAWPKTRIWRACPSIASFRRDVGIAIPPQRSPLEEGSSAAIPHFESAFATSPASVRPRPPE
jgi:hypothetical protein